MQGSTLRHGTCQEPRHDVSTEYVKDGIVSYRYYNIDAELFLIENTLHFLRESVTHSHAAAVYANTIQDGIRTREVDVFEKIRCKRCTLSELTARYTRTGDDDSLT